MSLLELPLSEINRLFIVEVSGFRLAHAGNGEWPGYWYDKQNRPRFTELPNYALSLEAVWPFLACKYFTLTHDTFSIRIGDWSTSFLTTIKGPAATICIGLIEHARSLYSPYRSVHLPRLNVKQ